MPSCVLRSLLVNSQSVRSGAYRETAELIHVAFSQACAAEAVTSSLTQTMATRGLPAGLDDARSVTWPSQHALAGAFKTVMVVAEFVPSVPTAVTRTESAAAGPKPPIAGSAWFGAVMIPHSIHPVMFCQSNR